jgi:hypothetical protein
MTRRDEIRIAALDLAIKVMALPSLAPRLRASTLQQAEMFEAWIDRPEPRSFPPGYEPEREPPPVTEAPIRRGG